MAIVSKAQRLISIIGQNPSQHAQKLISIFFTVLILAGCALGFEPTPVPTTLNAILLVSETPAPVDSSANPTATPEGLYQPMTLPDGLRDELPVMQGICYEAALNTAGRTFILRNAIDHIHFYEQMDQLALCRHPVTRYPFDFDSGRILVGFWQVGRGCNAKHEVQMTRDEAKKVIALTMTFVVEGTCPYELVRPFWVSIPDAAGWTIEWRES